VQTLVKSVVSGRDADELMQTPVMRLLARTETTGYQEGIHIRLIQEAIVRDNREAGLRLHGSHRISYEKGVKFGIEPSGHGEHAVRGRVVDNLGILENVNAEAEALRLGVVAMARHVAHGFCPSEC
jgi:hypothetical protein